MQLGKGTFDVLIECSGVAAAIAPAITGLRPRGVVVQLGLSGDMALPMKQVTAKELDLRGSFRFHEEFATGVEAMRHGRIDVKPLITHEVALMNAEAPSKLRLIADLQSKLRSDTEGNMVPISPIIVNDNSLNYKPNGEPLI